MSSPPHPTDPPRVPLAVWAGLALLTVYGAWRRAVDLDPPSLWLDDVWVAVLARAPSLGDLLTHGSSTPPLFALAVAGCARALPDPEIGPQLIPYAAGVALVPLTGYAAWRMSARALVAIAAALLIAADPLAIVYAARVKQYSTDAVVTVLHLLAFERLLRTSGRGPGPGPWMWIVLGTLGVLVSTVSLFVLVCFVTAWAWHAWRAGDRRRAAGAIAALGAASAALVVGVLSPAVNPSLDAWWDGHFLPTSSVADLARGASRALGTWVAQPLHGRASDLDVVLLGVALVGLGGRALWGRPALVAGVAALVPALLLASAARRFPVGTGRVELFLTPLVAILLAAGLTAGEVIRAPAWRAAWPLAALLLLAFRVHTPRVPRYPEQDAAPLVARAAALLGPEEVLVVNDHGLYALCYYGPWPVHFVPHARFGTGFVPLPRGVDVRVVETHEGRIDAQALDRALGGSPPRAVVFLSHDYGLQAIVPLVARRLGYARAERTARPGCTLYVLDRER